MKPVLWAELSIDELQARRDEGVELLLLPIGSAAPHGAHLPVGCDALIVETLCHAVSSRTAVPVLPTMSLGAGSGANALNLSPATLMAVINDVLESALQFGMKRAIILSGNAENMPALESALQTLRARNPEFLCVAKPIWDATLQTREAWHNDALQPHAGLAETALVQYLAPQLVSGTPPHSAPTNERVFPVSSNEVCGMPAQATPQMGAELFEALVSGWTRFVKRALIEGPPICGPPF